MRLEEALAAIQRVRDLHRPVPNGMGWTSNGWGELGTVCSTCGSPDEYGVLYPCPTLRALDG